jgi:peptidyl-prolyl cis-trans isomerase B (cyclophilin B)
MIGKGFQMKIFAKIACIALAMIMCLGFVACSSYVEPTGKAYYDYKSSKTNYGKNIFMKYVEKEINSMKAEDFVASEQQSDYVLIKVKDYGDIVVLLRHDVAPKTVENFKKLTAEGFYDGTIFHRVIKDFMIQGGGNIVNPDYDPENSNSPTYLAKESETIKGEFTSNGHENNLKHARGVISMARVSGQNDSASSQFFIIHEYYASSQALNGDYAAFGYVLAGMDVVDAIATCPVFAAGSESPLPVTTIVIESVTFVEPK